MHHVSGMKRSYPISLAGGEPAWGPGRPRLSGEGRRGPTLDGQVLIRSGAVALATLAALGLILVAGSAARGSVVLLVGAVLALAGLVRLMTASSIGAVRPRAHPADPQDPRWHGGSGEIQLAGRRCVECGRRITVATEGVACRTCSAPAHADCHDRHRAHAHRPASSAPFR